MGKQATADIHSLHQGSRIDGIRTGTITRVEPDGTVFVNYADNAHGRPLAARMAAGVQERLTECELEGPIDVLLTFDKGDPHKPVVFDLIVDKVLPTKDDEGVEFIRQAGDDLSVDGKSLTFNADEQIVLRCGKASITLTKAGKIIIRGAYLLNRSSGVNRIKGGSVQIN